jgi:hypothetical protein
VLFEVVAASGLRRGATAVADLLRSAAVNAAASAAFPGEDDR